MAAPQTITYATAGQASATAAFMGHARMTPQIDALTQPEKDMITAAATTAGRLQLTLSVNGMRSHHLFPATDHPHVPVAMPCYMIALPDPTDPTDPTRQGPSLLFVPIFSIQMDPMHHPQAHAAPAPRVATHMLADQPRPFVMEQQFQPLHTDPRTWGAAAIQALQLNGFSHAGRLQQVQAVLDNISPDTRHALITIHGASEMTPQDLVAKLEATYPLARSSASARGEVKDRACTNDQSWTDFVNKQLSDLINTYGSNTLSELLRGKTQAYIADWTKDAATMIVYSSPARVRATVAGSAAAWIEAVTDQATLLALLGTLHALDGTSSLFRRSGPQIATGAYLAQPAPPTQVLAVPTDPTAAMRAELEQLRASVATMTTELKSRSKGRPAPDFSKPWQPRYGLCRTCAAAPKSVNGTGPQMHWKRDCPDA